MLAIIDYGLGNLGSIANMLKVIGEKSVITNIKEEIMTIYLFLCLSFTNPNKYPTTEKPSSHNRFFKPKE